MSSHHAYFLRGTSLIWKEGLQDWIPASQIKGLFDGASASSPAPQAAEAPTDTLGAAAAESQPGYDAGPQSYDPPSRRQSGGFGDFLAFRKMITPTVIQVLFWLGVIGCLIAGVLAIVGGTQASQGGVLLMLMGIGYILLGPCVVRLYCELMIVIFRINDTLYDIRNELRAR